MRMHITDRIKFASPTHIRIASNAHQPDADDAHQMMVLTLTLSSYLSENTEEEKKEKIRKSTIKTASNDAHHFDAFWKLYPRKVCRKTALRIWVRDDLDEKLDLILASVKAHAQSAQWQDRQYIPHPSTWLNGERWEDEAPPEAGNGLDTERSIRELKEEGLM
jgi:hypothetical protein